MVDLEPFLEAPFEEASNLSFEVLLLIGIGLLVAVSVLGRSTVTTAAVVVYLCLIPGYVAYRVRFWDEPDETEDGDTANENGVDDDSSDETTGDEADGSDETNEGEEGL